MNMKRCFVAAAVVAASIAGTNAGAGLFDRLRERAEDRFARDAEEPHSLGFAVESEAEIGKVVTPVSYQPLPAPGNEQLVPVPEGQAFPPSGRAQSFYQSPSPVPAYPAPSGVPMGIESYPAGPAYPPQAAYPVGPGMGMDGVPLFDRVEYDDFDNIHPCAVPMIVQVLDPCAPKHPCHSCGPQCVYVKIMVPPGQEPRIKVENRGRKVKYKFADRQVEVESKRGYVEVDYDD